MPVAQLHAPSHPQTQQHSRSTAEDGARGHLRHARTARSIIAAVLGLAVVVYVVAMVGLLMGMGTTPLSPAATVWGVVLMFDTCVALIACFALAYYSGQITGSGK